MKRGTESAASALLAFVLGILGFIALAHWSACEQDDSVCLITWTWRPQ